MELKNKKIAFLGDSITEGCGASDPEHQYTKIFEKISNSKVDNFGVSATRIATRLIPHPIESWNESFIIRADKIKDDYDVIVIFGGTNDYANDNPSPLGTIYSTDEHTFYGALKILLEKLIKAHPETTIVICTPIHRNAEVGENDYGLDLCHYVNAIKEIAPMYSVPVIDLYANAGITSRLVPEQGKAFLTDGLHPNDKGHQRIAERIYNYLKNL